MTGYKGEEERAYLEDQFLSSLEQSLLMSQYQQLTPTL